MYNSTKIESISMSGSGMNSVLYRYATNKSVLEFGSGGSSLLISGVCKNLVSIESDRQWAYLVQSSVDKNTICLWKNIGPTKAYGLPIKTLSRFYRNRFKNYYEIPFKSHPELKNVEVVFIDGRFRVACAINAHENIINDFVVIFDDFYSRPEYNVVTSFLGQPFERVNDCAIFLIETKSKHAIPVDLISQYKFDFR